MKFGFSFAMASQPFYKKTDVLETGVVPYLDAWSSTVYSVKTVGTDFLGNIYRKCTIFFPELHLPNGITTSPHLDHSTGPKPIQLVQVVFTIE